MSLRSYLSNLGATSPHTAKASCLIVHPSLVFNISTQYNLIVNTPITSVILLTGKRKPIPRTWESEIPVNRVFSSIEMDSWCQIIQRGPYLKSADLQSTNRLDISWKATCKVIVDHPKDKLCQEKTNEIYTQYFPISLYCRLIELNIWSDQPFKPVPFSKVWLLI